MRVFYQIALADNETGWAARQIVNMCNRWGPFHVNAINNPATPHAHDKITAAARRRANARHARILDDAHEGTREDPVLVEVSGTQ